MTPDQYRREGAEAMREAAATAVYESVIASGIMHRSTSAQRFADAIRAIDPAEVMAKVGEVETTPAPDAIARLVEALEAMLHAVCGETGFAACVRHDSGLAYPWPALEAAEEKARSVLRALKGDE